jgi:hypothetical protein
MPESCALDPALARKNLTAILQALASAGQKPVGEALGKSETWVSRWKSEDAKTCADLLAVIGQKVGPAQCQCYSDEYMTSLRYFAKIGMAQEQEPRHLDWDEPA